MASRTTITAALGLLLVIVAIFILPLSAHPSYHPDEEDRYYEASRHSPGMRRLTWWRWGRRNENKREKVSTEPPTTTAAPMMEFITTTKKPSRWRTWFSKAKEKISKAAKTAAQKVKKDFAEVKHKYEHGMLIVGDVSKDGFYKAGKAIALGVKKVGNATIKAGRTIKKGAKRFGSAVKRGYQKIRLRFAGPDEKFKILANRIKDKVESGDERAVELLKKIGIHVNVSDQKVVGSQVVNKNVSVTEILRNEGMLSNKSSSYFTTMEEPEKTVEEEEEDEFHSAEEDLATETNITDTKVEYERATTENTASPDSRTSTLHLEDTTTETSLSTFSENVYLHESSTQANLGDNVDSTTSILSTEAEGISPTITKSIPLTDSVSTEYSTSSTKAIDTSDFNIHSTTMNSPTQTFHTTAVSPYDEFTSSSSVNQPNDEVSFSENTTASVNVISNTETSIQTTSSTVSTTAFVDIHKPIFVNTMRPLHSDLAPKDDYETTTLSSSPVPLTENISSTTQAVSSSTLSFTSPDFVTIPEGESSVSTTVTSPATTRHSTTASTVTSTAATSAPTVEYVTTTFGSKFTDAPTTSPSTTTTYTSPTTSATSTPLMAATSTTTALPPTTSTTTPVSTSTSTTITMPPTTSTTTTLSPTTSTTTTLSPTTSTTTTLSPTTSTTVPPTTTPPPPPPPLSTTTTSSTYPPTTTVKTHPPKLTESEWKPPASPPSTSIRGDEETAVEEAYVPPPFPDVFSDVEVHDRLREFYDHGDFSHAEMAEVFNFDPDNYEYYKYDYNYEDYA
ncbi:mucin-2-like [Macrobrachium rosenbergii]|uniref:mucin-2-like n=1 Tax=Macrobrachium rosenbergii TaxID=79674 RepID=UPI0034D64268